MKTTLLYRPWVRSSWACEIVGSDRRGAVPLQQWTVPSSTSSTFLPSLLVYCSLPFSLPIAACADLYVGNPASLFSSLFVVAIVILLAD
jgi:hypothetical protein